MINIESIREPIKEQLKEFEEYISQQFNHQEDGIIGEMIQYALSTRGKAIRPTLVLLAGELHSNCSVGRRSMLASLLVEMVHTASLIHDDVIDEAETRRGRSSINAKWQSKQAVLLGDYILSRTLSIGFDSAQFDLVSYIIRSMTSLCEGELLQSDIAKRKEVSIARYLEVIHKKTATLLGVSAASGAMAVGASREAVNEMKKFGEALGMAFQIEDDILDYQPDAKSGKPTYNDLKEGKITLPLILSIEQMDETTKQLALSHLEQCNTNPESLAWLIGAVEQHRGIELAAQHMVGYISRATSILEGYDPSPYRTALLNMCAFVMERDN